MRAIRIDSHGGPEVLSVREVSEPTAGPGEVLIRTAASSLNPVDWKTRAWDIVELHVQELSNSCLNDGVHSGA
jgi:NADPH:quinone reductase-like Zn-dependent oxidoreductase